MFKTAKFINAYSVEKETHPFRIYMERHTILRLIGNIENNSILDLACGSGSYSRLFCKLGAKDVTGVDYGIRMIEDATKNTPSDMPISYIHDNGESFRSDHKFDLVFHAYLLNYASCTDSLRRMCETMYCNLDNNGRTVGITSILGKSPSNSITCCDFYTSFNKPPAEGEKYEVYFRNQDESITNYNWGKESYHKIFESVGFKNIKWHYPEYTKSSELTDEDWDELTNYPVFLAVSADK
ncbi:MAG: class I SAM-dependent methyltransferase [Desulfobacterales bacterium]|nr:class I SAM-dependent methyltransferase [Desulfobacterales bacterium]